MYMASHQTLAKPEPSMAAAVYNLQRAQSHELVLDNYAGQPLDQDFWQPQWDADEAGAGPTCDAGPACLDAYDDEEEGVGVLDTPAIPEVDEALSTRYAAMLVDRNETELFDRYNSVPTDKYEAELCRVLAGAFSGCFAGQDDLARLGSKQMMQQVAENCNYAVESVVRIMNKPHHSMQQAFAKNYRLDATRTVYHGTSEEGATSITAVGFKGAAGRRAKFGRGMYSSPIVWEALGYAKPFRDVLQVLFVCELLQGPSAQGSEDQVRACRPREFRLAPCPHAHMRPLSTGRLRRRCLRQRGAHADEPRSDDLVRLERFAACFACVRVRSRAFACLGVRSRAVSS